MLSSRTSSIANSETPFQIPSSIFGNLDDILVHRDLTTQDHFFLPNVAIGNVADSSLFDNFTQDTLNHDQKNNVAFDRNLPTCDPLLINLLRPRWKKPDAVVNKQRHRKIVTAQGARDRRVRLSIQIARQFFDLQDNLGFDKASQTVDWLLTKSKSAIEEVTKIKQSARNSTAANELENNIEAAEIGDDLKTNSSVSSSSTGSVAKDIGISIKQQHSSYTAKELRVKARERARERTKAKMLVEKLNEPRRLDSDYGPNIPNSWNQLTSRKLMPYFSKCSEMSHSIAESILIKRKLKPLQDFTANQQNLTSSRQVLFSSTTITENREINNNFSQESPSTSDCGRLALHKSRLSLYE